MYKTLVNGFLLFLGYIIMSSSEILSDFRWDICFNNLDIFNFSL